MTTINLHDAASRLPEIITGLTPGEQVVIVDGGKPLATLMRNQLAGWPCTAGSAKHLEHWMAPDFDAPLEDFREYMQ